MIRCGKLCNACGATCGKDYKTSLIVMDCPICDGKGGDCQQCVNGRVHIDRCPREYVGEGMTDAINMATMSGNGDWPVAGGIVDQAAWFVGLKHALDNQIAKIENEENQ